MDAKKPQIGAHQSRRPEKALILSRHRRRAGVHTFGRSVDPEEEIENEYSRICSGSDALQLRKFSSFKPQYPYRNGIKCNTSAFNRLA
jgi:hypothetical protein